MSHSAQPVFPTQYPEVNRLLNTLLAGIQPILGAELVSMMLFGSLAYGGFDAHSDIDVLVVPREAITPAQFDALHTLHTQIAADSSAWAVQLEVSYIPTRALRRYDPADADHPHLDRGAGERLTWMQHGTDWITQRHVLREHGIVVYGAAPRSLIDPITVESLQAAMRAGLKERAEYILGDPMLISRRGYQSYNVLTVCRMLYTLETGAVTTKAAAAHWAAGHFGAHWRQLIDRAWIGRAHPDEAADPADIARTLDWLRFAVTHAEK